MNLCDRDNGKQVRHFRALTKWALIAVLTSWATCSAVAGDVVLIGRAGPAGPAGALVADQIAHWPTQTPLKIVDRVPETISPHTSLLLELTEDFDFRGEMPVARGDTIEVVSQAGALDSTVKLAQKAADAINAEIDTKSERFAVESKTDPQQIVPRITVVTSTKDELNRQRIAKRTRQLRVAAQAILAEEKVIGPDVTAQRIAGAPKSGTLRVAFYDDIGARNRTVGANPVWVRQSMRDDQALDVYLVSARDIRAGALSGQFDALIMGGGSSKTEAATLGESGMKAVEQFVHDGGGYVGICAGAFLAAHNSFGLGIAAVRSKPTGAGGEVDIRIQDSAIQLTKIPQPTITATFHGGPILIPTEDANKSNIDIWATFTENLRPGSESGAEKDEDADNADDGKKAPAEKKTAPLKNTPAIVANDFGKGRVIVFGPHCERVVSNQPLFWTAVHWAGRSGAEIMP